ncbi:MAG: MFS transporter [Planctomycetota bacterium]|jgi:fucose permease
MGEDGRPAHTRRLTVTSWIALVVFASTSALVSVSLKEIGQDLTLGFALKGALAPIRSAVLAVSTFLIGYCADRTGMRWLLGGGMCVVALGLLCIGRSETYVAVAFGMAVLGMGLGSCEALLSPLVAELHPTTVATHMNVLHGFFPAGVVASSVLVGQALDVGVHWRSPFVVAALPALAVALVFLTARYPGDGSRPKRTPLSVRSLLRSRTFWLLAVAMALTAGCEGSILFWTPNFVQDEYAASALVGAGGLTAFCVAMAVGRFGTASAVRFVPLPRLMTALAFLGACVALCLALVHSLPVSVVTLAGAGLCVACFWPGVLTLATDRIAVGSATLLSMLSVAGIAGFGGIPLAVGLLAEHAGLRVGLLLVPAAFAAAGVVLLVLFGARPDGTEEAQAYP